MNNKKGFTLAEVLTTLMVIGVVAALTIPSMMNSYKKHVTVVKLKKVYSQLSQAMKMIPITEGCDGADYECAGFLGDSTTGIVVKRLQLISKQFDVVDQNFDDYSTGTIFSIYFTTKDNITVGNTMLGGSTKWIVDINGKDVGPNQNGIDRFVFVTAYENKNGISIGTVFPQGARLNSQYTGKEDDYWQTAETPAKKCVEDDYDGAWNSCAARILEEGKITYY